MESKASGIITKLYANHPAMVSVDLSVVVSVHLLCPPSVLVSECLARTILRVWPVVRNSTVCFGSSYNVK